MSKQKAMVHVCPVCTYTWETVLKGHDVRDCDGNILSFRENCPECGWVQRISNEMIELIVKASGKQ